MIGSMDQAERVVRFDPFEEGFRAWPYDQYARLRTADPVHHSDLLRAWVLTRHADVDRVLRDPSLRTDVALATPTPAVEMELRRRAGMDGGDAPPLPLLDPPDHTRVRQRIAPAFRKGAVRDLAGTIARHVDALLDAIIEREGPTGTFDLVADLAYPMPVLVICELMGIPDEDGPTFRRWVQLVAEGLDPTISPAASEASIAGGEEMRAYLRAQLRAKVAEPGDDLTSTLARPTAEGERLSEDELVAQLQTLYIAGHEPATAVLGNGFHGLLQQPDQLARLRAEPALVEHAVLELLRYDGPNQFVRRVTTTPLPLSTAVVPAGAVIYAGVGAANHDPEVFGDDADRLRIDRPSASQHLQLGAGLHACLGTHLARLEIEIASARLLQRFAVLEPAGAPTWADRMILRSVNELPVRYTAVRS